MDSRAKIISAMQSAFYANGIPEPERHQISTIIGLNLDEAVARLAPDQSSGKRAKLAEEYRRFFNRSTLSSALFAGVQETLKGCQDSGFELAIATGKSHGGLMAALNETNIEDYFSSIRTADRCPSKPAPDMVEEILDELGIQAHEALVIGDTAHDLQMAQNAGVRAVAACYGAHPRDVLAEHKPMFYLDSIAELLGYLPDIIDKLNEDMN